MKKVVLKETQEVSIDQITDETIVGIEGLDGSKIVIVQVGKNKYCGLEIGDNSLYCKWYSESQKAYVKEFCSNSRQETVYLFETKEEIVNWLKS